MKTTTSKIATYFAGATVAAVALLSLTCGACAAQDDAPNPFGNLDHAQQQVTSYEKENAAGPVDLHSIDVDYTVSRLTTALGLTPTEQTAVRKILSTQKDEIDAVEHSTGVNKSDRMQAIYRDTNYGLVNALTPDQQIKIKFLEANEIKDPQDVRMEKLFEFDARFAALPVSDAATQWGTALNLDATQKLALLPILESEQRSLDSIATEKSLSANESRLRTQQVMIDTERKIDGVMTSDQQDHLTRSIAIGVMPSTSNPRSGVNRRAANP
jgi:hypothetical protein